MAHLVHNERTKLLAGALDRAGTSCFTVGVLAPLVAAYVTTPVRLGVLVATAIAWLAAATALHWGARRVLKDLRE